MLSLKNVEVIYDDVILVLKGLSLEVPDGQIVALLGSNGAGKSTTLKAISGLLHTEEGEVTDGAIEFLGQKINGIAPEVIVQKGIFQVMEGRRVFEDLTVDENIVMGGYTRNDRAALRRDHDLCYDFFPRLKERRKRLAGYLSGGEQQMLAISRALMARPKLMMLDEPSLGLAPQTMDGLFQVVRELNQNGLTVLMVEQNARQGLASAHRGYVLELGKEKFEGTAQQLLESPEMAKLYLGGSTENGVSYRRRRRESAPINSQT